MDTTFTAEQAADLKTKQAAHDQAVQDAVALINKLWSTDPTVLFYATKTVFGQLAEEFEAEYTANPEKWSVKNRANFGREQHVLGMKTAFIRELASDLIKYNLVDVESMLMEKIREMLNEQVEGLGDAFTEVNTESDQEPGGKESDQFN